MEKLVIGRDAYDKIRYYVDRTEYEISGLGVIENIKGVPTVTDIILLKQENGMTETDLDPVALNKADYDFMMSKQPGALKFWWHSHNSMDVYWSSTDMAAIKQLTGNGDFFHGVFNHAGEYRLAYSNNKEYDLFLDDLNLEIDETLVSQEKLELINQLNKLDEEMEDQCEYFYKELVTEITYKPTYKGGYPVKELGGNVTNMHNRKVANSYNGFDDYGYMTDWKKEGRKELEELKFTKNQIDYLNDCDVFDLEDVVDFERTNAMQMDEYFSFIDLY